MAFLTSNWTTHLWHRLLHPLKLRWPVDDTNNTIKFSQQREREVIWLIRAEILEKRPVRRQYITVLTTGTIKLLCHVLFLAWEQGLFIPHRLNIQLCLLLVVNGWRKRSRGRAGSCFKTESKATNSSWWSLYWPAHIDQHSSGDIMDILFTWLTYRWTWGKKQKERTNTTRLSWMHMYLSVVFNSFCPSDFNLIWSKRGVNKLCQRKPSGSVCSFNSVLLYKAVNGIWLHTNCITLLGC